MENDLVSILSDNCSCETFPLQLAADTVFQSKRANFWSFDTEYNQKGRLHLCYNYCPAMGILKFIAALTQVLFLKKGLNG